MLHIRHILRLSFSSGTAIGIPPGKDLANLSPPCSTIPDLTFGVELEFIVVYDELAFENCTRDTSLEPSAETFVSAVQAIEYCLWRNGIGAILAYEDDDPARSQPRGQQSRQWTVKKDYCELSRGERPLLPPNFIEKTVELSSRVFAFADNDFRSELTHVLDVLNSMKLEFGCEILTKASTGVHVHIGRRHGADMPLQLCKRVFQLATAHEHNIDAMHKATRVLAPISATNFTPRLLPHYMPPSAVHRHNTDDSPEANVFEWLERVELVHSREMLRNLFRVKLNDRLVHGHCSAYNFDNLGQGVKNTIEFRQYAGTLDLVEISAWVSFVCRLVEYCHQTHDVHFMHLLCQATNMDFQLVDLLIALEVHTDLLMHYNRDGGEALLGILPAQDTFHMAAAFDDLIAQNDHEQEQDTAVETVYELIARKSAPDPTSGVSYDGLIPSVGVVYCHEAEHLRQLLVKAYHQAQSTDHAPDEQSNTTIGLDGYARALVFAKLSLIYADQESGAECAVRRHLADWQ